MAAQIFQKLRFGDKHSSIESLYLDDEGVLQIGGFGDLLGNETFVCVEDSKVKIYLGRRAIWVPSDVDNEDGETLCVAGEDGKDNQINVVVELACLEIGAEDRQRLVNGEHDVLLLHVQNIGDREFDPMMN